MPNSSHNHSVDGDESIAGTLFVDTIAERTTGSGITLSSDVKIQPDIFTGEIVNTSMSAGGIQVVWTPVTLLGDITHGGSYTVFESTKAGIWTYSSALRWNYSASAGQRGLEIDVQIDNVSVVFDLNMIDATGNSQATGQNINGSVYLPEGSTIRFEVGNTLIGPASLNRNAYFSIHRSN